MKNDKIILYQENDRNISIDVLYENETFWLTQKGMAELFEVDRTSITKHLNNIFLEGEFDKNQLVKFFHILQMIVKTITQRFIILTH